MNTFTKVRLMALSFMLSLVLWVYVQKQENPTTPTLQASYQLPIEIKNLPANLVVISKPDTIKIFPKGPVEERARIKETDLGASVDLRAAKAGTSSYPIDLKLPSDVAVRFDPKAPVARIVIENNLSKDVPVRVEAAGQLTNPDYFYQPESTFASPPVIRITGPESDVKRVTAAYTVLDLSLVGGPGKVYTRDIYLVEDEDRPASSTVTFLPKSVQIHPAIAVGLELRSVHVLPIYKGEPAPGYQVKSVEITPEDVLVRGRPDVLSTITIVRPQVDLTGLKQTANLTLAIDRLPGGATISAPVTAKIVIEPIGGTPAKNTTPAPPPKGRRRRTRG